MNRNNVYALVTISTLLATALDLTRKYVMKHMNNYSIVFIDSILTGITMVLTALYLGGTEQIAKDIAKLHGTILLAFLAASLCITISTVIGYNLLRAEKLSYLIIVSTGVGVIATMFASALFLGEKITKTKLLSIPFLLTGVYLAQ
jgi:drug/metabolite transporter (DMT)-like permease